MTLKKEKKKSCVRPLRKLWQILHGFACLLSLSFEVKIGSGDPKSRPRDIFREVAQRSGAARGMLPSRREPDKSGHRRPELRHRGWSPKDGVQIYRCGLCTHDNRQALRYKGPAIHFPRPLCNRRSGSNVSGRGLTTDVCLSLPSSHSLIFRAIGFNLCGLREDLHLRIF